MKKLLILTTLLFLTNQTNAESQYKEVNKISAVIKSAKIIIPIYSQKLAFQLPTTWKAEHKDQKPSMFMMELLPKDENINSWQNLLTIQGFKNLASRGITPERFISDMHNRFKNICGKHAVFEKLEPTMIDGFSAQQAILGCSKVPNQNYSETAYWLVIKGKKDIYVVQKALRTKETNPITKANYQKFTASITPVELCNSGGTSISCEK